MARQIRRRGRPQRTLMTRPERACPARRTELRHCSARTGRAYSRAASAARGRRRARRGLAARHDCPPGAPHEFACGNESGSFAACRRARCVLPRSPPPSPPCRAPRRAFSARKGVVGRGRDTVTAWSRAQARTVVTHQYKRETLNSFSPCSFPFSGPRPQLRPGSGPTGLRAPARRRRRPPGPRKRRAAQPWL